MNGEAEAAARVAADPDDIAARLDHAAALLRAGRLGEAEGEARNAVRLGPLDARAHAVLGRAATEANRLGMGAYHYRRALELGGAGDPVLLGNLAWNLRAQGRMAEARAMYRAALAAAPGLAELWLGLARLEEEDGDFAAALAALERVPAAVGDAVLRRAVVLGRMGATAEALALLEGMTAKMPAEWLERGRLLEQLGQHRAAWEAFAQGKLLAGERSGLAYLDAAAGGLFGRLRGFFVRGRMTLLPRAPVREDVPQPLFVMGFPRSGTTLVEQMLSAHPQIGAGDELPAVAEISAVLPRMLGSPLGYPEALSELWLGDHRDDLEMLRDHYLRAARQAGAFERAGRWFTDKMPLNETHMGLICLMFPDAPLIHVVRHPLDVMVSAFGTLFTHGFFCGAALESLAVHYARVLDLVAHYTAELSPRLLTLKYEDLVLAPEPELRRVLAFVGADFDPACLAFHANGLAARTPSYAQVREPLYVRSIGRWRPYREALLPVIPVLAPAMTRLGYSSD
jgi:tetratricopeptide (TPR) repeat protein